MKCYYPIFNIWPFKILFVYYSIIKKINVMKVKDLIKFLSEQDQNLEVVIKHIDHTDWNYELPLRAQDVYVDEVFEVDEANLEEGQVIESGDECLVIELSFE